MDLTPFLYGLRQSLEAISYSMPTLGGWIALAVAVGLLLCSAFVSASEIAFFSLTPADLNEVEDCKHPSDSKILDLRDHN